LRQISPDARYCKVVFADDWIFPQCLAEMVAVAEEHPSVGIVGAYGLQGHEVMWAGLPYPSRLISGREVCRRLFLEELYVFGTSTSLLYRADLVRSCDSFYNEGNLHADMETCVVLLKNCDFGFVHQILTFKRVRPQSLGAFTEEVNTLIAGHLHNLVAHGRDFLTPGEYSACLRALVNRYYNFLAVSLLRGRRDRKFWEYHKRKLNESQVGFSRTRLAGATLVRLLKAIGNPSQTVDKIGQQRARSSAQEDMASGAIARPALERPVRS